MTAIAPNKHTGMVMIGAMVMRKRPKNIKAMIKTKRLEIRIVMAISLKELCIVLA